MGRVRESLKSVLVHLYADTRVAEAECHFYVSEVQILNRPILLVRFPSESIANVLFRCPLLAPFWLTPFYGSQQAYEFHKIPISRPLPEAPVTVLDDTTLPRMEETTLWLTCCIHTGISLKPVTTAPFGLKSAAFAAVRINNKEAWAPAIRMAPLLGIERAAIWTSDGWAPLILNDTMWATLRAIEKQEGGLPMVQVSYRIRRLQGVGFLLYPTDDPHSATSGRAGDHHAASEISLMVYTSGTQHFRSQESCSLGQLLQLRHQHVGKRRRR